MEVHPARPGLPRPRRANTQATTRPAETAPNAQLYDLGTDLGEQKNLADQRPDKVKELQARMDRYKADGRSRP